MAHHEEQLTGDADAFIAHVESAILNGSETVHREHASDRRLGDARMLVRVYERYSFTGGNRVSMSVSVLAADGELAVTVVAAGGSTGVVFKVNTLGEEWFLDHAVRAIAAYPGKRPPRLDADGVDRSYMDADGL